MGRHPKRGHFSRSRSLEDFNRRFKSITIEKLIKKALNNEGKARVLEIGCGEGRVLMQLRKLFPKIELHGINKKPWPAMKGQESLKRTATFYKIFTRHEMNKINLPKIHFYNARKLDFKNNYFDLIYSQVAIHYVDRKDILFEDIWRVLKKGGKALLHFDTFDNSYPDFMRFETPRFVIFKNGKISSIRKIVKDLRKKGYDISVSKSAQKKDGLVKNSTYLIFNKNTDKPLKFNLKFDETSSFDLNLLNREKDKCPIFWGYRSVYRMQ